MAQFSLHDAKINLSQLIDKALAGGDVIIISDNAQLVRLVPIAPRGKRRFGALKAKIGADARFNESLPEDELAGWNGSGSPSPSCRV